MELDQEQKNIIKNIIKNKDKQEIQKLFGYAGTGKTVIITVLARILSNFAVCAYTGKAASILRRRGISRAATIHSLIYQATRDEKGEVYWEKKNYVDFDGFVVDEASMISKEVHNDLLSFGKPIIYVGDHGQLEPIGTDFNLMHNPDYTLEKIHRNAGEIAFFAEHLRKGNSPQSFKGQDKVQIITDSSLIEDKHLASVDQILCAYNKTRVKLNEKIRKHLKINYTFIAKNERIMCLRNNRKLGLFNGMQGIVTKVGKKDCLNFKSYDVLYEDIRYDPDVFGVEKYEFSKTNEKNPFDYAYAITVHKAQGDSFGNMIVYEEKCQGWDHKRWTYTAASRAKNGLIWICANNYVPKWL